MKTCVYPGSFDPVTGGHLDLITRASAMFDKVTVVVMINRSKKGLFPVEKRCELLRKACRDLPNVEISHWDGSLMRHAAQLTILTHLLPRTLPCTANSSIQLIYGNMRLQTMCFMHIVRQEMSVHITVLPLI